MWRRGKAWGNFKFQKSNPKEKSRFKPGVFSVPGGNKYVRPHPGLLPQEKEKGSANFGVFMAVSVLVRPGVRVLRVEFWVFLGF
jgi:hypothetical protein